MLLILRKYCLEQLGGCLLYGAMRTLSTVALQELREKWESELSVTINDNEWEDIWIYAKSISVCNRAKSIQFKILHRMHISPNRRHHFNPTLSPMCLKCKTEIGTLTHCQGFSWVKMGLRCSKKKLFARYARTVFVTVSPY